VARFRDVLKVTPRNAPPVAESPAPAPRRATRKRWPSRGLGLQASGLGKNGL